MADISGAQNCILTIRLIRSFEHRNIKHLVLKDVDLDHFVKDFMKHIDEELKTRSDIPPPFRKFIYDSMKVQHKAHGAKTSDPVINTENDLELMLNKDKTLRDNGVEHETEISYFKMSDYEKYKENPHTEW